MNGTYSNQRFNLGAFAPDITWAVRWLILANAAVFAGQLVLAPLEVAGGGVARVEETFGFSAASLFHGMLWLFFFGPEVERLLGSRQFIRFYLACGALAVLVPLLPLALFGLRPTMCGASGSVMGVLVAFAMIDPKRQFFLFPLPVPVSAVGMVVLIFVMNVVAGLNGSMGEMVTHLGGMGAGYALMKAIPWYYQWRRDQARDKLKNPKDGDVADKLGAAVDNIFKFNKRK